MSLAEGILWFLSTFLGCWGATLIVRGLRGEGIRKKWAQSDTDKKRARFRPTWKLVGLGLGALTSGLAAGWYAGQIHEELSLTGSQLPITPWQIGSAGILVFGVILLTHASVGDRSNGRKRCPRCWYDLRALRFSGESAVCSECGRKIAEPSQLVRSRRSTRLIVVAGLVVVLGAMGLSKVLEISRPAQLIPGRVLVWWLFAEGEAPQWVRVEIKERSGTFSLGTYKPSTIGPALWRAWIDEFDQQPSILNTPGDTGVLLDGLMSMRRKDSEKHPPFQQLNAGWQTQGQQLLARLCSEDPSERSIAAESIESFEMLMMLSLMVHPEITLRNPNAIPSPAIHYEPLTMTNEQLQRIEDLLASEPAILTPLESLLGWHLYEQHSDLLLELRSDPNAENRTKGNTALILGSAALYSAEASQDLTRMLESNDQSLVEYAIIALRFNTMFDNESPVDKRQLAALLRIATETGGEYQMLATKLLFQAATNDISLVDPLTQTAMNDPIEAQRLIGISISGFDASLSVRDVLFETLSESDNRDVRFVIASAEQPWIDLNGKIRPVLEKLAQDPDPEIAAAAEDSLRVLQDE